MTRLTEERERVKVSWKYIGEELALFWINPWDQKEEKIATFWWPAHPMEETSFVEKEFEKIAFNATGSEIALRAENEELKKSLALEWAEIKKLRERIEILQSDNCQCPNCGSEFTR